MIVVAEAVADGDKEKENAEEGGDKAAAES